jgi:hypothetical protein
VDYAKYTTYLKTGGGYVADGDRKEDGKDRRKLRGLLLA